MTGVRDLSFDQIQHWVGAESAKGRSMKEIVAELATRDDVTLLSVHDSPETRHQKIIDSIQKVS